MVKQLSKERLKGMSKQELYDYCKSNGIKGYSGKTKQQRIDLINNYYESGKQSKPKTKYEPPTPDTKKRLDEAFEKAIEKRKVQKPKLTELEYKKLPKSEIKEDIRMLETLQIAAVPSEQRKLQKEIDKRKLLFKPKSTKQLGIYIYSESIRSEGIGDVLYIIATTSKSKALARIKEADISRASKNWISQRISPLDDTIPTNLRKIKEFDPFSTPEVLYMFETHKMVGSSVTYMEVPKLIKKWEGSKVVKKQPPKKESEIKWNNIHKKWRDTSVQFGTTKEGNKLKAYILRTDYPNSFVYTVKFSIYSPEKKKWLDYNEHRLEFKDQEEKKVINLINNIAFDIKYS